MLMNNHNQIALLHKPPSWALKGTKSHRSAGIWKAVTVFTWSLLPTTSSRYVGKWSFLASLDLGDCLNHEQCRKSQGLAAVWTTRKGRCSSWNQTSAWHAHTEQPLWQSSQHNQAVQGTAAPQQLTRHLQLPFRMHSYVLCVQIKRQTEALQVFRIYLIVGHQRSTTHYFSWAH